MAEMTAEQALKAGEGLNFTQVWTSLMELRQQQAKTDAQLADTIQTVKNTSKKVDEVSDLVGKMGNSQGKLLEEMFSAKVWDKFNEYGYDFTKGSSVKFKENGQVLAQIDILLENGDFTMAVEVKNVLTEYWVDDHLERIGKVRDYMNRHNDKRKLVGAVAGGVVPENVKRYAEKYGLYVMTQNGENVSVVEDKEKFNPKVWA
jgi:hypothetical protein